MTTSFLQPPQPRSADGSVRRVGFELEFAGVDLATAADVVVEVFGGTRVQETPFQYSVQGPSYGEFRVEIDARILKDRSYRQGLESLGIRVDDIGLSDGLDELEKQIAKLAANVVPCEIVTPPIPLDELEVMEELRSALRRETARGTRDSLAYAFGLHLNPEVPALESESLLRHLQAFLLLSDLLEAACDTDSSRRLLPYIRRFPQEFSRRLLDSGYRPPIGQLIDDYLESNPTRNRPLDMLPVLAHIDRDALIGRVREPELLKGRPAFHYRLPNCLVDDPTWSIAEEWNRWVVVERLADDRDALVALIGRRGAG